MIVDDIINIVRLRSNNIALTKNEKALIQFIYLGISELYRKFNLSIKSETIMTVPSRVSYELENPDVSLLLGVYDVEGRELRKTDVVDGKDWDMKILNYRSFVLNRPFEGLLYAVYKASPVKIEDKDEVIDLPDAMIDALLCYVTYMVHSSLSTSTSALGKYGTTDSNVYYDKFKELCNDLMMQGYMVPINSEMLSVLAKGYV